MQLGVPQSVPSAGYVHAARAVPSQVPSQPSAPVQAVREPWGAPVTAVHEPSLPPTSHASHWPAHAVSQHTESTQKVDSHSALSVHELPFAIFCTQAPDLQKCVDRQSEPAAHCVGQSLLAPVQTKGAQAGVPAAPLARSVQEPGVAVQVSHGPSQAAPQQTPSAQKPLVHSLAVPHAAPSARLGVQAALEQKAVAMHCASDVQVGSHAPVVELQRYGSQATPEVEGAQSPVPLQSCPETTLPVQIVAPQLVDAFANCRHAPLPSHMPSRSHDATGSAVHSSSGSVSATEFPQIPSAPAPFLAAEQALHGPVHAFSQHTLSTQLPDVHSVALVQDAPFP